MSAFDLDSFLPYRLALTAARISRGFARRYGTEFGLSIPEWRIIAHLSQAGSLGVRDLADRADLEKSKVSRAAARLCAAGLVDRRTADDDRRLVVLSLTEDGQDLMARMVPVAKAYEAEVLIGFGPRDRAMLDRVLTRLQQTDQVEETRPMTVLYDYWRSSAAYRVRIALNLLGIEHETVPVDLLTGDHKGPANLARNPQGLVPTLDIDGRQLTQSLAILEYLDETRQAGFLPVDPVARARVRTIAHAIAVDIHPVCNMSVARHAVAQSNGGVTMESWMHDFLPERMAAVEALLSDGQAGRYGHGDTISLIDLCLVPQMYNVDRWGVDAAGWPTVGRIHANLTALPAFAAAHPDRVRPD